MTSSRSRWGGAAARLALGVFCSLSVLGGLGALAGPGAQAAARPAGRAAAPAPGAASGRASAAGGADGFYTYPDRQRLVRAQLGEVFAEQPMTVSATLQRVSSRALRIMYRSVGLGGAPVAVTGVLLVPRGSPPGGGWPVVAWAHGTSGIGPACAPSRWPTLYPPFFRGYENLVGHLLADGFAVVATDYPGLGFPGRLHGYLQLGPESRAVADSVLAARRLAPSLGRNWFALGHSEGGQAALGVAELAPRRAPGLHFLGAVSIAPASHLAQVTGAISLLRPPFPAALSAVGALGTYIAVGAHLYAPLGFHYGDLLSPGLVAQMPVAKRLCDDQLSQHLATVLPRLRRIVNPRWASNRALQRFYEQAEPARARAAAPVLLLQGDQDLVVPQPLTGELFAELCAFGDVVQYRTYPGAGHDSVLRASFPQLVSWLHSRLAGQQPPQDCPG